MTQDRRTTTCRVSTGLMVLAVMAALFEGYCPCDAHAVTRSALEEKVSFNTEKQLAISVSGLHSFTDKIYGNVALQYGRYPVSVPRGIEGTYAGSLQAGYNTGLWGVDGSYSYGNSLLAKLQTHTFGGGLTFAYFPGMFAGVSTSDEKLDVLKASNKQVYQTELTDKNPIFWARAGVSTTTFSSKYLTGGTTSQAGMRQLAFTLDGYYPVNTASVLSTGLAIYGYNKDTGVFSQDLFTSSSEEVYLIGGTVQGLPSFYYWLEYSWQVTPLDGFLPRAQTTMVGATRQWDIGGALTWRRRLAAHLYMTPSYEISVLGSFVATTASMSFFHDF